MADMSNKQVDLRLQIQPAAEKQALHKGKHGTVGVAVVNRRSDNDAIGLRKLRGSFVHKVVENALPGLMAAAAGDTAADVLVADKDLFGLNTFRVQDLCGFLQSGADATLCSP